MTTKTAPALTLSKVVNRLHQKLLEVQTDPALYVFTLIFIMLVVKYLLLTRLTSNTAEFLSSYKFAFSDSYDWIANGVGLFNNDSITFRNPGLVLIIKFLYVFNALFLLPLLNNMVFFLLILFVYKLSFLVASKNIALIVAIFLALNFTINLNVNYIMADIYCLIFIAASLYYLLKRKYSYSFLLLGGSILFQNIGYLLLPVWLSIYAVSEFTKIRDHFVKKDVSFFTKKIATLCLLLSPLIIWNIYKFLRFGNPLYSRIDYFTYTTPHLDSIDFYALKSLSIYGLIIIPLAVYILLKLKNFVRNKNLLVMFICLVFNFLFWVVVYDWEDPRFLLYFIPFIYPLIAYFLSKLLIRNNIVFIVALFLLYQTTLPLDRSSDYNLPLIHNVYTKIDDGTQPRQKVVSIERNNEIDNLLMNLNPTIYHAIKNHKKFVSINNTWYSYYSQYIEKSYNRPRGYICINGVPRIRNYLLNSMLIINERVNVDSLEKRDCGVNK